MKTTAEIERQTRRLARTEGRFLAFSDGVFALAATLLVVSFAAPVVGHDQESDLTSKLVALWPQALAYQSDQEAHRHQSKAGVQDG